jgi:hypothetical protein
MPPIHAPLGERLQESACGQLGRRVGTPIERGTARTNGGMKSKTEVVVQVQEVSSAVYSKRLNQSMLPLDLSDS